MSAGVIERVAARFMADAVQAEHDAEDARALATHKQLAAFDPDPPEARKARATLDTFRVKRAKITADLARLDAERDAMAVQNNHESTQRGREHERLRRESVCWWRLTEAIRTLDAKFDAERNRPGTPAKAVQVLLAALGRLREIRDLVVDPPADLGEYARIVDEALVEYAAVLAAEKSRLSELSAKAEADNRKRRILNP